MVAAELFLVDRYECSSPPSSHDYCVKNGMGTAADEVFGGHERLETTLLAGRRFQTGGAVLLQGTLRRRSKRGRCTIGH